MRQMNIVLEIGELLVVVPSSTGWYGFGQRIFSRHIVNRVGKKYFTGIELQE